MSKGNDDEYTDELDDEFDFCGDLITDEPDWRDRLPRKRNGDVVASLHTADLILSNDENLQDSLGFDTFAQKICIMRDLNLEGCVEGPITDVAYTSLRKYISERYQANLASRDLVEMVRLLAERSKFNSAADYFYNLEWDKNLRLLNAPQTYLAADGREDSNQGLLASEAFKSWLIAIVAAVLRDPLPTKKENVLILVGDQGIGKSTFLEILGGEYYTNAFLPIGSKDSFQLLLGKLIVELDELSSLKGKESARLKQFFSTQIDEFRPPYGREPIKLVRQCGFAGTTNETTFLTDETGNRRYWPIVCRQLDAEALRRDKDQLWAEAVHYYLIGENWWLDDRYKELAESETRNFLEAHPWERRVCAYLMSMHRDKVYPAEIFEKALGMPAKYQTIENLSDLGRIMAKLKWKKIRPRDGQGGARCSAYKAPEDWKFTAKVVEMF